MSPVRCLSVVSLAFATTGCGADLSIVHERALIGQYRDVRLSDDAADLHARYAEPGATIGDEVVRQDFVDRQILDQLTMSSNSTFRDVSEKADIQVLFVERPAGNPEAANLILATTTTASQVYTSDGNPLYDAVLTSSGLAIAEAGGDTGCVVRWLDKRGELEGEVSLERGLCTDSLQIVSGRPGNSVGFTNGTDSGVAVPDGATSWEGGGDLLTWDPLTNAIVVGTKGETEIRAWLDDGTEAWYTDIGQAIEDFDSMGVGGAVALTTTVGSNGRIVLLDSVTGNALTAIDVPVPGREISAGTAGTHLALTLEEELHLFAVDFTSAR